MDDEELEARMRAADPARGPAPADSWIDDLVEATLVTDTSTRPSTRRAWAMVAAAAAVVAVVGGGAWALTAGDDDDRGRDPTPEAQPQTELTLTLPEPDAMQMCVEFSPEVLAPLQVALSGEATEVDGSTVRLTPDHWYRGGDADVVVLEAPSPDVLLEGGIVLVEGERYLIGADRGQVATCGLSGPYSTELAAAYEEAFGG